MNTLPKSQFIEPDLIQPRESIPGDPNETGNQTLIILEAVHWPSGLRFMH
jgi:hypothetical protein